MTYISRTMYDLERIQLNMLRLGLPDPPINFGVEIEDINFVHHVPSMCMDCGEEKLTQEEGAISKVFDDGDVITIDPATSFVCDYCGFRYVPHEYDSVFLKKYSLTKF